MTNSNQSTLRISVSDIFKGHYGTYKNSNNKISDDDKMLFIWFPLLFGLLITVLAGYPSNDTINFLAIIFSVFIGLFLNILVLIISSVNTKIKDLIKDQKNRKELIKATFYNISYTILVSLFALIILIILRVKFYPDKKVWDLMLFGKVLDVYPQSVILHLFSFVCYAITINIFLTLISIIIQIFKLFEHEIKILDAPNNTNNTANNQNKS